MLDELLKTCDIICDYGEVILGDLPATKRQLFAEMLDTLKAESTAVKEVRQEMVDHGQPAGITNTQL